MIEDRSGHTSFGQDAGGYFAFRPPYPAALFAWLRSLTTSDALAWDCGTGSGQSAVALADHFKRVIATDPDRRQIDLAPSRPNVDYRLADAETDLGLRAEVDLVTCACSIHWFDLARFYANVRLALKPNGVIAVWTYDWPWTSSERVNLVLERLKDEILAAFWDESSVYYFARYENLPFPFTEIDCPEFRSSIAESPAELLNFLSTWSAVRKFRMQEKTDPLSLIQLELQAAWRAEPPSPVVEAPLHMRVGLFDHSCGAAAV